jgi:5-methyltetrahydrofolate--homocysteine methyltransferase
VRADVYEKIDKELLEYVEDVLLNRCENATERMLEFAALLDPKSSPTKLKKLGGEPAPSYSPKINPIPSDFNPVAVEHLPPVPEYKTWVDPLKKSAAFEPLEKLFQERIAYIDGAMGTMIQRYKLQVLHISSPTCRSVQGTGLVG